MRTFIAAICLVVICCSSIQFCATGCSSHNIEAVEHGAKSQDILQKRLEKALRTRDLDGLRLLHYSTNINPNISGAPVELTEIRVLYAEGQYPIEFKHTGAKIKPTPEGIFLVLFPSNSMPEKAIFRFGKDQDGRYYLCTFGDNLKGVKTPDVGNDGGDGAK